MTCFRWEVLIIHVNINFRRQNQGQELKLIPADGTG